MARRKIMNTIAQQPNTLSTSTGDQKRSGLIEHDPQQLALLETPQLNGETTIALKDLFQQKKAESFTPKAANTVTRTPTMADVKALASAHREVFPDYFLSHLGQNAVEAFYTEIIRKPGTHFSSIAESNGQLIGFVAGTRDSSQFFRNLYRNHFVDMALGVCHGLLTKAVFRKQLWDRRSHILRAVQSRFLPPSKTDTPQVVSRAPVRLLSIGVISDQRKSGTAESMLNHFLQQLNSAGIQEVGLSVFDSNKRAICFYEKTGWQVEFQLGKSIYFWRSVA
jgi:ribosomal protein S18 acetylase RimI-like enzyme